MLYYLIGLLLDLVSFRTLMNEGLCGELRGGA